MKQCYLPLKDARDFFKSHNGKGFCVSRKIHPLFQEMDEEKESWLKDYSSVCTFHWVMRRDLVIEH